MTRRILLLTLLIFSAQHFIAYTESKMNVVLFLIDDLGWKDVGCNGSDYYQTPNIDQLAAQGMRFTNGYAACSLCSPSRAAILTGKNPARILLTQWLPAGRWNPKKHKLKEGRYVSNMALEEVTLAEAMREGGYKTAFLGKWHLGTETYYYPEHQGFDVNIAGRDYGAPGSYFYPFTGKWTIPSTGQVLKKSSPLSGKKGDYLPDRLAEEACGFIKDNKNKPFFVMISHYAVHTPLQAKPKMVKKYSSIPKEKQQGKPVYAAMVESVDQSVGKVMKTIADANLEQSTIVIFTSDNGGMSSATDHSPLRANKGSNYEGGIRVPFIIKIPGTTKPGSISDTPVIGMDIYPTVLSATNLSAKPYQHQDGVDLSPLFRGEEKLNREALFWHYPHYNRHPQSFPAGIIRKGPWKLIENFESGKTQLFNLSKDIGETTDLSSSETGRHKAMLKELQTWRESIGADPMKENPQYEGNP